MSTSNRPKGAPKHQNREAFHHNKGSKRTLAIRALPNEGLCTKCHEVIEWKKKYRKYKPLTQPAICKACLGRTVRHAYHEICAACALAANTCAKCRTSNDIVKPLDAHERKAAETSAEDERLAEMTLRQQKTYQRQKDREAAEERARRREERERVAAEEEAAAAAHARGGGAATVVKTTATTTTTTAAATTTTTATAPTVASSAAAATRSAAAVIDDDDDDDE